MTEELQIKLTADLNNFTKGLDKAMGQVDKMGQRLQSAGKKMTVALTAPLTILGGLSLKAASDAEETSAKFQTVFRDISEGANASAKELRNAYGLSSQASEQLLSDTGDLLTGFGFTQESALKLSTEVNKLAVDLASFTNFSGGAEGASQALTKALLGERDSVKSLGISILETDVQSRVLENTQKGLTFETNRQAKAFATLELAQEQSKNAIGDYARTSEGFANQSRLLQARVNDLSVEFGKILLPIANKITDALSGVVDKFTKLSPATKNLIVGITALVAAIGPLLVAVGFFSTTILPALVTGFSVLLGPIGLVSIALGGLLALFIKSEMQSFNLKAAFDKAAEGAIQLDTATTDLKTAIEALAKAKKENASIKEISQLRQTVRLKYLDVQAVYEQIKAGLDKAKADKEAKIQQLELMGASSEAIEITRNLGGSVAIYEEQLRNAAEQIVSVEKRLSTLNEVIADSETATDDATGALESYLVTLAQAKAARKEVERKAFESRPVTEILSLSKEAKGGEENFFDSIQKSVDGLIQSKAVERAKTSLEGIKITAEGLSDRAGQLAQGLQNLIGGTFTSMFTVLLNGSDNAMEQIGQMFKDLLIRIIATIAAAKLLSLILSTIFPGLGEAVSFPVLANAGLGIPAFANGGIVSGPTLGLIGEYSGARSNPEVVAPLDKLKSMMGGFGQKVVVEGRIKGSDVVLSNERSINRRTRRRGF